jgi:hypothetical protein
MLPRYDMQGHLDKEGIMANYLVWRGHREVEPPAAAPRSDENEDEDQMDAMIADIHREYDPTYGKQLPPSEV